VIRPLTQEAYEVAMHSKLASDWELFVTRQKNKDETTKRLCSHDRPSSSGGRNGSGSSLAGSKAAARHAIRSMLKIVRYAKASELRMERRQQSRRNYNGVPEHQRWFPPV
jgi:hypothetical protein